MQQQIVLKLLPSEAEDENIIKGYIAASTGKTSNDITGYFPLKKSIDARGRKVYINLTVHAFINEPFVERKPAKITFPHVGKSARKVVIVGAGPTGLFAALKLIEEGVQPIILERGKDVRARRRDLAALNKGGVVNPDSNYCFGEGGAGTYSDGKLYTRSNKRGDINRILNLFVQFGAEEQILVEAHPHIGTNKLPQIITAMRECIVEHGGIFLFEKKVSDLVVVENTIKGVVTADGDKFEAEAVILATGHSARDIFKLLHRKGILIEAKPFALGVRIEHPQSIIDNIQYHSNNRGEFLPPASYALVQQVEQKGVFSFCMCPGGIIAPASTDAGELVVNGWSPSKRNNPFANSGMVVTVENNDLASSKDFKEYTKDNLVEYDSPLNMMFFQEMVERKAYVGGGGHFVAPAQRMEDFCNNKTSGSLPVCSYLPGISSTDLRGVLPPFIHQSLQEAFKSFGIKMRGYLTNEAVVVATESRSSSPVRIPRDSTTLQHPQVENLYPCGEGAGYAGGIVSAAMDGERVALMVAAR
ncbi:NAD(P)/FAD-dependent oxidoreductase [Segetibacter aerophilus]|uniref:FAD-dependent dehydrogenase n=1 Tax=Segetibacter aerophilus TaxID=670293 RepID=A0A512BFS9_9BACT|nr:FAD-dependent oxidoreductase [Segetibacter aerophilus]GEO10735.1 FAD-dependent dehydrogenase [Segetibacter aerophilus]